MQKIVLLRTVILVLGVGLIIAGILLGELTDILRKAVTICLECVGIG